VQTCALPISRPGTAIGARASQRLLHLDFDGSGWAGRGLLRTMHVQHAILALGAAAGGIGVLRVRKAARKGAMEALHAMHLLVRVFLLVATFAADGEHAVLQVRMPPSSVAGNPTRPPPAGSACPISAFWSPRSTATPARPAVPNVRASAIPRKRRFCRVTKHPMTSGMPSTGSRRMMFIGVLLT